MSDDPWQVPDDGPPPLPHHYRGGVSWRDEMTGREVRSWYGSMITEAYTRGVSTCVYELIISVDSMLQKHNAQIAGETIAMAAEFETLPSHECNCFCVGCCATEHCEDCKYAQ